MGQIQTYPAITNANLDDDDQLVLNDNSGPDTTKNITFIELGKRWVTKEGNSAINGDLTVINLYGNISGTTGVNPDVQIAINTADLTNTSNLNADIQTAIDTAVAAAASGGWDFIQSQTIDGTPSATASGETWIDTDDGSVYKSTGTGTGNWVFQFRQLLGDLATLTTDSDLDLVNGELIRNKTISEMQRGKGLWFNGSNDEVTIADDPNVNFGTDDFSIVFKCRRGDTGGTSFFVFAKGNATERVSAGFESDNKMTLFIAIGGVFATLKSDNAYTDTDIHIVACVYDRSGGVFNMFIDGKPQSGTGTFPSAGSVSSATTLFFGQNIVANNYSGEIYNFLFFNRLLTDSGAKSWSGNPFKQMEYKDIGANQTDQTSGTLIIGKSYRINTYISSDDFTNVGAASNATGVEFIATGTTPTTWTNSSILHQTGCMGEWGPDGITHKRWLDAQNRNDGAVDATVINAPILGEYNDRYVSYATDNNTFDLPAGTVELQIIIDVITQEAGTTLRIGTSNGGEQVVADVATTSAGFIIATMVLDNFRADDTLYIGSDGGAAWTTLDFDLYVKYNVIEGLP